MNQLIAHLIGDYILQNHWMAVNKTSRWIPALIHVTLYTIPFLFITTSLKALFIIWFTHLMIDRFRLAQYVPMLMNWNKNKYPESTPLWLSTWIIIIIDNTLHLLINYLALK
jgi:hypothetical protein